MWWTYIFEKSPTKVGSGPTYHKSTVLMQIQINDFDFGNSDCSIPLTLKSRYSENGWYFWKISIIFFNFTTHIWYFRKISSKSWKNRDPSQINRFDANSKAWFFKNSQLVYSFYKNRHTLIFLRQFHQEHDFSKIHDQYIHSTKMDTLSFFYKNFILIIFACWPTNLDHFHHFWLKHISIQRLEKKSRA